MELVLLPLKIGNVIKTTFTVSKLYKMPTNLASYFARNLMLLPNKRKSMHGYWHK